MSEQILAHFRKRRENSPTIMHVLHLHWLTSTKPEQDGRFWQTSFTFLLELLARQLYRPTLAKRPQATQHEARWQPILDGESEARRGR